MTERVIERVEPWYITVTGIDEATLTRRLSELENKLRSEIALSSGSFSSSGGTTIIRESADLDAVWRAIALTNKIDELSSVTLRDVTFEGTISGLTDGNVPDGITASNYLPLAGGALTGDLTVDTSVFVVDATNNRVGIGTSTPTDTFSLNGPAYLSQIGAPSVTTDRLYNTGGDLYWAGSLIGGGSVGNWATDGTDVWRTSGDVGVGTTTPWAKLSVDYIDGTDTGPRFVVGSSTAANLIVSASGNVGVSTSSPYAKLSVTNTGTGPSLVVEDSTSPDSSPFVIDATGNIGVGTNSPTDKLTVSGGTLSVSETDFGIQFGNPGNAGPRVTFGDAGILNNFMVIGSYNNLNNIDTKDRDFKLFSTADTVGVNYKHATGRLGIGTTSPWGKLSVDYVDASETDPRFIVGSSTATNLIVDATGNVGIGASIPQDKLYIETTAGGLFGGGLTIKNTSADGAVVTLDGLGPNGVRFRDNSADGIDLFYRVGVDALNIERASDSEALLTIPRLSGNVGVSTSSPYAKLSVTNTGTGPSFIVEDAASPDASPFIIDAAGQVMIGTTTPRSQLHIADINAHIELSSPLNANNEAGIFFNDGAHDNKWFIGRTAWAGLDPDSLLIYEDNSGSKIRFAIRPGGNIGIGTTTPWRTLSVNGTVGFDGLAAAAGTPSALCLSADNEAVVNTGTANCTVSSERFKHDIEDLALAEAERIVAGLNPVSFRYNATGEAHLGLIAEQVDQIEPRLVAREADGRPRSVRYDELTAVLAKVVAEHQITFEEILGASAAEEGEGRTLFERFADRVKEAISSLAELVVPSVRTEYVRSDVIEAGSITTDRLCLEDLCVTKAELKELMDGTDSGASSPASQEADAEEAASGDQEPPVIEIVGDNPAVIEVGARYSDNGARVTDNVNDNLGYTILLDGEEARQVELDTSTPGTHEITYTATDQAGNTASATRIVKVSMPHETTGASSTPQPSAATAPPSGEEQGGEETPENADEGEHDTASASTTAKSSADLGEGEE